MTICENMDYVVRQIPLPAGVYGHICEDSSGRANITINSNAAPERKKKALLHEFKHMIRHDSRDVRPVDVIEAECDADATPLPCIVDEEGNPLYETEKADAETTR